MHSAGIMHSLVRVYDFALYHACDTLLHLPVWVAVVGVTLLSLVPSGIFLAVLFWLLTRWSAFLQRLAMRQMIAKLPPSVAWAHGVLTFLCIAHLGWQVLHIRDLAPALSSPLFVSDIFVFLYMMLSMPLNVEWAVLHPPTRRPAPPEEA